MSPHLSMRVGIVEFLEVFFDQLRASASGAMSEQVWTGIEQVWTAMDWSEQVGIGVNRCELE